MKNFLQIILILLFLGVIVPVISFGQAKETSSKIEIKTSAVCGDCKTRIEHDLSFAKGVKKVILNLEDKVATVLYNPQKTNPDLLRKAINQIGYDADVKPALAAAYNKLPACCKKGNAPH